MPYYHYPDGAMGWGMPWMGLGWILFILAGVVLVAWAVRTNSAGQRRDKTALDILKERYARGEIDKAEFEQMRRDLEA